MTNTDPTTLKIVLGLVLAILSIVSFIAYLELQNRMLKSELSQSQLQIEKDENAQAIHSLSDDALKSELNQDFSGDSTSKSKT